MKYFNANHMRNISNMMQTGIKLREKKNVKNFEMEVCDSLIEFSWSERKIQYTAVMVASSSDSKESKRCELEVQAENEDGDGCEFHTWLPMLLDAKMFEAGFNKLVSQARKQMD